MMADMHVYKDHIESLKDIDKLEPYPFPTLKIDPSVKSIDDFEFKHFEVENYMSHKKIQIKMSAWVFFCESIYRNTVLKAYFYLFRTNEL